MNTSSQCKLLLHQASEHVKKLDLSLHDHVLDISKPMTCWIVAVGYMDVFWQPAKPYDGVPPKQKAHVMRIQAGEILFGFEPKHECVAVASADSEVYAIATQTLYNLATDGATKQMMISCIDTWLNKLCLAATSYTKPQQTTLLAGTEKQWCVQQGEAIQAMDGVIWVDSSSQLLLNGIYPLDEHSVIPISQPAWLETKGEAWVDTCLTEDIFGASEYEQAFAYAQDIYVHMYMRRVAEDKKSLLQAIDKRQRLQQAHITSAIQDLALVIEDDIRVVEDLSSIPLVAACQYIAQEMGFTIKVPQEGQDNFKHIKDPLALIARASGFRTRRVTLSGEWWNSDHGPLLAFQQHDEKPYALIQGKGGDYLLIDPQKSMAVKVDNAVASKLKQDAYMLYAPLPQGKPADVKTLFISALKGRASDIWRIVLMVLFVGILSMATPLVTEQVMSIAIPEAQYEQMWVLGVGLIAIAVASALFSLVQSIAVLRIEGMMDNRLQAAVWDKLLRLPSSFFRRFTVGDLLNRASGVDAIRQLLTSSLVSSLIAAITGLFSFILMMYYNVFLALSVVALSLVLAVLTYIVGRQAILKNKDYLIKKADIMTDVLQYLNAMAKLRVSASEADAFSKWAKAYAGAEHINIEQNTKMNIVTVSNTIFTYMTMVSIFFVLAMQSDQLLSFFTAPKSWHDIDQRTLTHTMSVASFIAFNTAYGQFSSAISKMTNQAINLAMAKPLYERLKPILDAKEENTSGALDASGLTGDIEIKNVYFRYSSDTPLVLKGLSLQVKAGEFVALVGPSGAGKSSLIRLLLAFDSPESGSIFFDGKDIRQLQTQSLRQNFGVVLQHGQLFAGSVFDNITAGSNANMDDAWWAAKRAGFDQDIENMPMGMHTVLSEGGTTLSGGQRQRLMIARAIINHPRILIFDEATSALDNKTQAIVHDSLQHLNCTRIAIAHRLSTIRHADKIYVIDAGKVVEEGTFDTLIQAKGVFYNLAKRQEA
jgi:NHLM bacteriocin system ABC transporter ATP-binding protein